MSYSVYLRVGMVTVIIYSLFRTPQIAGIIQYLIGSIIEILIISRHLSHSYQKGKSHKSIISPYRIYMRPQPGNSAIGEPGLGKHQMMIGAFDIFPERFVRMLPVQINQACSHRSVIVQTFITINHVPVQGVHRFPTLILQRFFIQSAEIRLIVRVKYEIHVFQYIVFVFGITQLITQFH